MSDLQSLLISSEIYSSITHEKNHLVSPQFELELKDFKTWFEMIPTKYVTHFHTLSFFIVDSIFNHGNITLEIYFFGSTCDKKRAK